MALRPAPGRSSRRSGFRDSRGNVPLPRELTPALPPLGEPLPAPADLSADLGPGVTAFPEFVDGPGDRVLGLGHDLPDGAELRDVGRADPLRHGADHADGRFAEVAGLGAPLGPLAAEPAQVG